MERINFTDEKERPHFIGSWNIKNDNLCKEIISFFEENKILQKPGAMRSGRDFTKKKNNRYWNKAK